jgi:hypothetical protein
MDCAAYRLTDKNQRIELTSQNTIPGATSVWALVNEGPAEAIVFASNGDEVPLGVFSGKIYIFSGDGRYTYTVGLGRAGSARVHVCR